MLAPLSENKWSLHVSVVKKIICDGRVKYTNWLLACYHHTVLMIWPAGDGLLPFKFSLSLTLDLLDVSFFFSISLTVEIRRSMSKMRYIEKGMHTFLLQMEWKLHAIFVRFPLVTTIFNSALSLGEYGQMSTSPQHSSRAIPHPRKAPHTGFSIQAQIEESLQRFKTQVGGGQWIKQV